LDGACGSSQPDESLFRDEREEPHSSPISEMEPLVSDSRDAGRTFYGPADGRRLFARSLIKLQNEDVGFDRNNVLLLGVDARLAGYKDKELPALDQQLLERLGSLPQVSSVSMATYSPMSGTRRNSSINVPATHQARMNPWTSKTFWLVLNTPRRSACHCCADARSSSAIQ
jgi:hypothetical protein